MTQKHTPGPWAATFYDEGSDDSVAEISARSGTMQICEQVRFGEEDKANFRLIAAAPELLAALKLCAEFIESLPYEPSLAPSTKAQDAARDAIAKAEGR